MKKAQLIIDGLQIIEGVGIGKAGTYSGELVFNTSMSGYTEALTDPSYENQILLFSFPLIGNYGVSQEWFESKKFCPKGLVCKEVSSYYTHFESKQSLESFMQEQNVGGITGVDTRALVRLIRKMGTLKATIIVSNI